MTIGTLEQQVKIRRRFLTIDQISVPISNVTFYNLAGTYLNIIKRTVKFLCPADVIPPYIYIDVDLSELGCRPKDSNGRSQRSSDSKASSFKR